MLFGVLYRTSATFETYASIIAQPYRTPSVGSATGKEVKQQ
jgi:hypothetical protein